MTKPRHAPLPPGSVATLPVRAMEALQDGRFKDAIELLKQLTRQEKLADWQDMLADAYAGRGRELAGRGMFKEAAAVLENTLNAEKILREPALYVSCLIRENQQAKAAAYLLHCAAANALPPGLEELTAALLLSIPQLPAPTGPLSAEATRWRDLAGAARAALSAWIEGKPAAIVEGHLAHISVRSAFRPVRLLLKTLITQPVDAARTRQVLESITPDSAFFPLRTAVEAASRGAAALDAQAWQALSGAQQAFVAETGGLTPASIQAVGRLSEAARGGSGNLFSWLLKQGDLPRTELRSACLNLLVQHPDRTGQFEKTFGTLSEQEKLRIAALAAEARGHWRQAESAWSDLAATYRDADSRLGRLSAGVIYRHLASLARKHPGVTANGADDPCVAYLERSNEVDPEHLPTVLTLIAHYRAELMDEEWHRLADEAVQRFPDDSQVLLAAIDSSAAREAYETATALARRLLSIDPINTGARRQMIGLQMAHARKHMRDERPDLAAAQLALAAEWDRPEAPDASLAIIRGLVALRNGEAEAGEAWVQRGAALAGGGVAGCLRIVIEAEQLKSPPADIEKLRDALNTALATPPTRPALLAVAAALSEPTDDDKHLPEGVLPGLLAWLRQGADIAWTVEEFAVIAGTLTRLGAFGLLGEYAEAARRREPGNPEWRLQQIIARTHGDSRAMTCEEEDEVDDMLEAAGARDDLHARARIIRFLDIGQAHHPSRSVNDDAEDDGSIELDAEDLKLLVRAMVQAMPDDMLDQVKRRVSESGREGAIQEMFEEFRDSTFAAPLPDAMLRQLCRDMVAHALGAPSRRKGRV